MRSINAGLLVAALATSACFPHNAKHRRIAKISEGGAILTGIALQLAAAKGACMDRNTTSTVQPCDDGNLDEVGLVFIFAGLVGFAATTISGHPDFDPPEPVEAEPYKPVPVAPLTFCAALYAQNIADAQSALNTYIRSQGILTAFDATMVLHAWLSRQGCVHVTSDIDASAQTIDIVVRERAHEQYTVDATDPGHIVMHSGFFEEL